MLLIFLLSRFNLSFYIFGSILTSIFFVILTISQTSNSLHLLLMKLQSVIIEVLGYFLILENLNVLLRDVFHTCSIIYNNIILTKFLFLSFLFTLNQSIITFSLMLLFSNFRSTYFTMRMRDVIILTELHTFPPQYSYHVVFFCIL